jgi:hypothetical protein
MLIINFFIFLILQFFIFIFIHIVLNKFRIFGSLNPIFAFSLSLINFFLIYILFIGLSIDKNILSFLIFHITLVMIYFHLFIGILKSVSVRVLIEILSSKENSLSFEKLNSIYSYSDLVNERITLLLKKKWVLNNNNVLKCSKKGKVLVRINLFLLKIYRIKNSG